MSHCIAILKVILFGFPRKKGGWSPKHPCAQTVRVERGLRKGTELLQGGFCNMLEMWSFCCLLPLLHGWSVILQNSQGPFKGFISPGPHNTVTCGKDPTGSHQPHFSQLEKAVCPRLCDCWGGNGASHLLPGLFLLLTESSTLYSKLGLGPGLLQLLESLSLAFFGCDSSQPNGKICYKIQTMSTSTWRQDFFSPLIPVGSKTGWKIVSNLRFGQFL